MEINWSLLGAPVDIGAHFKQGMQIGQEMVAKRRRENALGAYMTNPDDVSAQNALALADPDMAYKLARTRNEQQEAQTKAAALAAQQRIGQQYVSGDQTGAVNAAIGSGQFDLAKTLSGLAPDKQKQTTEFLKGASSVAYQLRKLDGKPEEQRAFFETSKAGLVAMGADPALLAQFDPTDRRQQEVYITLGQQVGALIDQDKADYRQLAPGAKFVPFNAATGLPMDGAGSTAPPAAPTATPPAPALQPSPGLPTTPPQGNTVRIPAYAQLSSGYRTPAHNKDVGGVPNSYHTRRGADGQPLGRDYVPTGGKSMDQLYVDLKAANPHLEVIRESDHVHTEPRSGGQRQAAAKPSLEELAQRAIANGADPAKVRARMAQLGGR